MQLLCLATLLLSAVAVHSGPPNMRNPGPQGSGRNNGRPQGSPRGEGPPQMMNPDTQGPGRNNGRPQGPTRGEGPPHMMNPDTQGPGRNNGRPQGPPRGEGPPQTMNPGIQGPGGNNGNFQGPSGGMAPSQLRHPGPQGPGGRPRPPQGPPRGEEPHTDLLDNIAIIPAFKVDNVTFQNTTSVPLKEGVNIFLKPEFGKRERRHPQGERHGPPKYGQYVKLIYNSTMPDKVSLELGSFKPMNNSGPAAQTRKP